MIQNIKGTKDLLPDSISKWHHVESVFHTLSDVYGYKEIRTPIFEKTEVFSRSIGENTDIVNKEMYTFLDKGGDSITLRPEKTAALVRSVIQHTLARNISDLRLWYFGPFFRYEQPQKGRLRQFHQYGAECISSPHPESDAEVLLLANSIIKKLGLKNFTLLINTLGTIQSRQKFTAELVKYLESVKSKLSEESQKRIDTNPLRVLDSKVENDIELLENAPVLSDYLDEQSLTHFSKVRDYLEKNDIAYQIDSKLVRGLDYYSHTVFEFQSSALGSQSAFGGGGRYDGLFGQLGAKDIPAVGFAMGVERILLILEEENAFENLNDSCDVYVVNLDTKNFVYSLKVSERLRDAGIITLMDLQHRSLKAQMKEANKLNAAFAIIIGDSEISSDSVEIKDLKSGEQIKMQTESITEYLTKHLQK